MATLLLLLLYYRTMFEQGQISTPSVRRLLVNHQRMER